MEPEFESLLADESAVREALGVSGQAVKGWPTRWASKTARPDRELLAPAIAAIRRASPKLASAKTVRRDWATGKNEWALYILRRYAEDPDLQALIEDHPIVKRLSEVGPA